ncbi:MAG: carbon-nitrogen hydrolase family protein [Gammaproteobacteria bacterium]|nr:carbon-nitrogen hydrolase family protein [Gammaproteobacteria bacterium]
MLKVAVVQTNSQDNVKENLQSVSNLIQEAHELDCQLVLLPENFAFIGNEQQKLKIAETAGSGLIQDNVANLAKKHNLWILAGTIPIKSGSPESPENKVYAASMLYDNQGAMVCRYDKIHLFDVSISNQEAYCESNTTLAGNSPKIYKAPFATIGFSVCYDVRFPELYRTYSAANVDILTVPSAFVYETGKAHWEVLNRARAIENQSFVLAANQCGKHPENRRSYGHSMIINPWGEIMSREENKPGVITATLDLKAMHKLRKSFPVINHRKLGLSNEK